MWQNNWGFPSEFSKLRFRCHGNVNKIWSRVNFMSIFGIPAKIFGKLVSTHESRDFKLVLWRVTKKCKIFHFLAYPSCRFPGVHKWQRIPSSLR